MPWRVPSSRIPKVVPLSVYHKSLVRLAMVYHKSLLRLVMVYQSLVIMV